jgi:hypothetical protein
MAHSGAAFKSKFHVVPCGLMEAAIHAAVSVAGLGVRGPSGPRAGNSSGVLPGNSSGLGGAPGSRTGGGISGLGLPGGIPGGGSVGVPGVAGGISGGSIGISFAPSNSKSNNGEGALKFPIGRAMELPHAEA